MMHKEGYFVDIKTGVISMQPTGEWVLVRIEGDQFNDIRQEGNVLVVEDMPKQLTGEVISCSNAKSPKGQLIESELSIGDKVVFPREARNLTEKPDEFLVRESDILFITGG